MRVSQAMTRTVVSVTPQTTVREAAEKMLRHDVGALPVLVDDAPVGIVTDRDLVVRVLPGAGATGDITVGEVMSPRVVSCFTDQDIADAAVLMGDLQVRRLMVFERSGAFVGILSIGDIAADVSEELAGQTLGEIIETR
jgi:CBS domain-containing protein